MHGSAIQIQSSPIILAIRTFKIPGSASPQNEQLEYYASSL